MRKLILLILWVLLIANAPGNSIARAQTATPSGIALPLSACQFNVGIGSVKHTVPAQCGIFSVPEDYSHANRRKLDLHIVALPALKPDAKGLPIFHLEGGPGGSAISNFGEAWFGAYETLRQDHPVVLIDQRGTGLSASLQCTEISGAALDDLAKLTTAQNDAVSYSQRLSACLKRLSKTVDPQFFTTNALADDTDAVRAALGYDQIDVFGNSYGTSLAQIYLGRHGAHVAAMALDSVTGPWNHWTLAAAANGQAALDNVFALCKADAACNKAYPDLAGKLQTALDQLQKTPQAITALSGLDASAHDIGMTADRLREAIFQMLYNSANESLLPQAINDAANGNFTLTGAVLIAEAQLSGEISMGLYQSVVCSEIVPFLTPALIKQYQTLNTFTQLNSPAADARGCKAWRSAELNPNDVAPVKSDRPVLILSGGLDPITPVSFGQETHARLTNSALVALPYQAHGVIVNSRCAQLIVAAFLAAPAQPVDSRCTTNDLKPIFLGAYSVDFAPFNNTGTGNGASFTGFAPAGWKAEQSGVLTFFTSPDGLQFAAAGIYKNQKPDGAKRQVLDQLRARYGTVDVEEEQTVNMLIISITAVVHTMTTPDQAYTGLIYLRPMGSDTYVVWNAAPSNWFQAASAALAPQMLGGMQAR